jgi:hypothetical protein
MRGSHCQEQPIAERNASRGRKKSMFWVCLWSVLLALSVVGLPLSIYYQQKSDSDGATGDIKSHQETLAKGVRSQAKSLTEGVKAHQETLAKGSRSQAKSLAEDVKTHQESLAESIKSQVNAAAEDIKLQIHRLGLDDNELLKKYPFGCVVYSNNNRNRNRLVLPLVDRGDIQPDADWRSTEIMLDPARKWFEVTFRKPLWKKHDGSLAFKGGVNVGLAALSQCGSYTLGRSILASVVIPGHPNIYLEVVDDNPNHETCIIGFKNLSPDDLKADGQPLGRL